jgi:hypothetical protein
VRLASFDEGHDPQYEEDHTIEGKTGHAHGSNTPKKESVTWSVTEAL